MKRTYVIGHWALTLLLAPFISQLIQFIWGTSPHQVVGLLEVYPISLLFSIAFSIPTFIIYLICFYFLSKRDMSFTVAKIILIVISVLGIVITQTIIKGSMSRDIIASYSITAIVVGLLLRLKETKTKTQDNRIPT